MILLPFLLNVAALSGATTAAVGPPEALVYRTVGARKLKAFIFSPSAEAFPARTLPINAGLTPVDSVEDACAAFAWARRRAKQLSIDTNRVAGYGVSAG